MSLANNKTAELWRSFMPRRNEIRNAKSTDLFSLQVYKEPISNINQEFEKWALVEVSNFDIVPKNMETFELDGGLYAVFSYKGLNTDPTIFNYLFTDWLPKSNFEIDNRPHFEILGKKYKNNDPNSEEEIWIPIKNRK